MCDPLTLTSLALTAGGAVANNMAANEAAKARSSVLQAERERQQSMERRQTGLSDQSLGEMENFTEDQQGRVSDLTDYFLAPTAGDANEDAGMVAPEGTSSITTREMQRQGDAARGRSNQNAANIATMRSFGDLMGDRMRSIGRNSSAIDQLTGFRRGSSDAMAFEMDAASQRGAGKRLLGDVLGGLGSVVGGYGAMTGAGNPVVTNMMDRYLPGGDRLAAGLRGAGLNGVQSVRGGLLG